MKKKYYLLIQRYSDSESVVDDVIYVFENKEKADLASITANSNKEALLKEFELEPQKMWSDFYKGTEKRELDKVKEATLEWECYLNNRKNKIIKIASKYEFIGKFLEDGWFGKDYINRIEYFVQECDGEK